MTRLAEHDRRLMLSFVGTELPPNVAATLTERDISGFTLFRHTNYADRDQLRSLTTALQDQRRTDLPLLIAIDQEGGQLHAMGAPATMWPGNMALGAVDDPSLTHRVGAAIGRELRAAGVNVNYAPVADLASNPANPATGGRAFGDDPHLVSRHVGAMVEGLQSSGVAATMKHFPGKGDAAVDSHHALPLITHDRPRLESHEFLPFRSAIAAGVKVAMTGHFALPAITGSDDLPCTLAHESNTALLRGDMGFTGVMITDALDMRALRQGAFQIIDIVAAIRSGVDLLLLTADPEQDERASGGVELAASRRLISRKQLAEADGRVLDLRAWVGKYADPDVSVIGSAEHRALAEEVAQRSITLLRNDRGLLPLDANGGGSILVVECEPAILTPADTSDLEPPTLADAVSDIVDRAIERRVVPPRPTTEHITDAIACARRNDIVIVGTAATHLHPEQADMVNGILQANDATVVVSMRTPWDLTVIPAVTTHLCAWSVHAVSMRAAARAIFGLAEATGRSPVGVGEHPAGFAVTV